MVFKNLPFPEACFLMFHGVDSDVSINAIVALAKQKGLVPKKKVTTIIDE